MTFFQQEEEKYCCGAARPQFLLTNYRKHSNLQQPHSRCSKFTEATAPPAIKIIYIYVNTAGGLPPPLSLTKNARASARCLLPACRQALQGSLGWGWGWGCPGSGSAGSPMGCCLTPSHPLCVCSLQPLIAHHYYRNHCFTERGEVLVFQLFSLT